MIIHDQNSDCGCTVTHISTLVSRPLSLLEVVPVVRADFLILEAPPLLPSNTAVQTGPVPFHGKLFHILPYRVLALPDVRSDDAGESVVV
jgi:hypothetical protein